MNTLILNSGAGTRMGELTSQHPKCMTEIQKNETIISHQLRLLSQSGADKVVITTGPFSDILVDYCYSLKLPLKYIFVNNPRYHESNYIYSIYLARKHLRGDDTLLMHGDLVFEPSVLEKIKTASTSVMAVRSTVNLPEKDFKAVVSEGRIQKIGIEFFDNAVSAQPLYKLLKKDWELWLDEIESFCEKGDITCYSENAFNCISSECLIYPFDIKNALCREIDTPEDREVISSALEKISSKN